MRVDGTTLAIKWMTTHQTVNNYHSSFTSLIHDSGYIFVSKNKYDHTGNHRQSAVKLDLNGNVFWEVGE